MIIEDGILHSQIVDENQHVEWPISTFNLYAGMIHPSFQQFLMKKRYNILLIKLNTKLTWPVILFKVLHPP